MPCVGLRAVQRCDVRFVACRTADKDKSSAKEGFSRG